MLACDDAALAKLVRDTKTGILTASEIPADRMHVGNAAKKACPEGDMPFQMGMLLLPMLEAEVRSRGLDPSHPVFGEDILPEILEIMIEEGVDLASWT